MKTIAKVAVYLTIIVIVGYFGGGVVHELINYDIAVSNGINATIHLTPMYGNDCPWNCQPNYTALFYTSFNNTDYYKLAATNSTKFNNFVSEITFNEHQQSTPSLLILLLGSVLVILPLMIRFARGK